MSDDDTKRAARAPVMAERAAKITSAILADLRGRKGFRQEWDGCDADVHAEIVSTWERIVRDELGRTFAASSTQEKTMGTDETTGLRWEVGQVWSRDGFLWRVDAVQEGPPRLAFIQSLTTEWARTMGRRIEDHLRDGWVLSRVGMPTGDTAAPALRWELGQVWTRNGYHDQRMRVVAIDEHGRATLRVERDGVVDHRPFHVEGDSQPFPIEHMLDLGWKPEPLSETTIAERLDAEAELAAHEAMREPRIFFVDEQKGNDVTGVVGDREHPFCTWEYVRTLVQHRDHVEFINTAATAANKAVACAKCGTCGTLDPPAGLIDITADAQRACIEVLRADLARLKDALVVESRSKVVALDEAEKQRVRHDLLDDHAMSLRAEATELRVEVEQLRVALRVAERERGEARVERTRSNTQIAALQQQLEAVNERICIPRNSSGNDQLNAIIALHEKYEDVARKLRGRPEVDVDAPQRALDKPIRSLTDVRTALGVPEGSSLTAAARDMRADLVARRADVERLTSDLDATRSHLSKAIDAHIYAAADRDVAQSRADGAERERNEARAVQTTLRSLLDVINAQLHLPANATWETTLSALKAERTARTRLAREECADIARRETLKWDLRAEENERHGVRSDDPSLPNINRESIAWARSHAAVARRIEVKIRDLEVK